MRRKWTVSTTRSMRESEFITIPREVECLEKNCFCGCELLEHVSFEGDSHLARIDAEAFRESCLKDITIPREVDTLDDYCFYKCEFLEEVIFADDSKLRRIGEAAFRGSGLKKITIPREVETLECFGEPRRSFAPVLGPMRST